MSGAFSRNEREHSACKKLVGELEGKRPYGRPRCRWEGRIEMDRNENLWVDVDRIHVA
jgi:hypothetical protein